MSNRAHCLSRGAQASQGQAVMISPAGRLSGNYSGVVVGGGGGCWRGREGGLFILLWLATCGVWNDIQESFVV